MKFPTNAQPQVLRSLLNGAVDVAVERPETIQYYNSKVLIISSIAVSEIYFLVYESYKNLGAGDGIQR